MGHEIILSGRFLLCIAFRHAGAEKGNLHFKCSNMCNCFFIAHYKSFKNGAIENVLIEGNKANIFMLVIVIYAMLLNVLSLIFYSNLPANMFNYFLCYTYF